ncbi:outer membrane beta-barrel protein [Gracilimonas sp.]|uniref:outer membrane beta-barrel protein n=1 Tax=Gracilimonas sp. TaxID=1974203 RepID=UPI0032ED14AC
MNLSKVSTILFGIILGFSVTASAQTIPETGSLGIRANITGQNSVEIPYMLNESLSLAPYLRFTTTEDQSTSIGIGIRPRYYTGSSNALSTYFAGTLGFNNTSFSNNNNSVTDFMLGVGYGAEYFFSDSFSVSADANLNSRFGDSATNLSTLARVSASFYF